MRITVAALLLAGVMTSLAAQQPNSAAASLVIDGVGAAPAPGPFSVNIAPGTTATITMSGPPLTGFTLVNANPLLGGSVMAGALTTPFGIVDLGPVAFPPLEILVDGIGTAGPLSWIYRTGPSGSSAYPITVPAGGCPVTWVNLQAVFPDPASTWALSAATQLWSGGDTTSVVIPAGDDTSHFVPFACGATFTFFGIAYSGVYVNSNGNLTFGGPSLEYSESQSSFDVGLPRACALWDDLYPSAAGGVTKFDNTYSLTLSFIGVPEYSAIGSNTFSLMLQYGTGGLTLGWLSCTTADAIAGITPGGGLGSPATVFGPSSPLGRISDRITGGALGTYTGGAMESLNEVFVGGATAFNLSGAQAHFSPANPAMTAYTLH